MLPLLRPRAAIGRFTLPPSSRYFHPSSRNEASASASPAAQDHYKTLNIAYDASPAEVKKAFYSLSKKYHPDTNREESAGEKFMSISEAYSTLGTPAKRSAYDRDVLRLGGHHHGAGHRHGSYHSTGPAGGRAASGLSRRRSHFRGPPPSFWARKPHPAHGHAPRPSTSSTSSTSSSSSTPGSGSGSKPGEQTQSSSQEQDSFWAAFADGRLGGMGHGSYPFAHVGELAHFDRESHARTHRGLDERSRLRLEKERTRMRADEEMFEPQVSKTVHFFIISAIIVFAMLGPAVLMRTRLFKLKRKWEE